ncbi:WXG100 family type VII secretion target [Amycolatopsis pigmentata]|uniref:WXG100 family type VII secretion target n=1 Tax=Amycolatopsis pigmentata TaxID=450801 RepID=A0ABW5FLM5_9PSEU
MSGYDRMHGDVDAMRRTANNWRQSHEEVAGRNARLNGGNTALEAMWKGQAGQTFQSIEPERFGQSRRLTTTGDNLADTMVTSSNKYFDTDSDNGRVLGAAGGFHVDGGAISAAINT